MVKLNTQGSYLNNSIIWQKNTKTSQKKFAIQDLKTNKARKLYSKLSTSVKKLNGTLDPDKRMFLPSPD